MTTECIFCQSVVRAFITSLANGQTDAELTDAITTLCVSLGIENYNVCHGAVRLNVPIIAYIFRNKPEANPQAFCGLMLQSSTGPVCPFEDARFEWKVELPPVPLETSQIKDSSSQPLKIVVITDAHIDPLYEPYGVANCDEPTCCRIGQKPRTSFSYKGHINDSYLERTIVHRNGKTFLDLSAVRELKEIKKSIRTRYYPVNSSPAGYWGDYRDCDTPLWAFDEAMETIASTHKDIDMVYYIGDTIDHGVWETSYELINEMNLHLIDKMRKEFGDHIPVLPVIGNHESQPTNQFAPSEITEPGLETHWLYEKLVEKWGHYLNDEAKASLRERGGFSIVIKPGLRVISLNNNIAYTFNWWILYDPTDSKKHLDWFIEELYKAEQAGEKVHILTHIAAGSTDLTKTWTREYNRIINRFSKTITAEFNGHSHNDEFRIFYSLTDGSPINVAWGGGGLTPYTAYNLNYKIVTVDGASFEPQVIENYVYNLTEANLTPHRRPHWFQLYNFTNTFQLADLSPKEMDNLTKKMVTTDRGLLDIYAAFFVKLSDSRLQTCNDECKLNRLCRTVVTELWERQKCEELANLYNE